MKTYRVTVSRTETIVFAVDADDEVAARLTYLADGDEVAAWTTDLEVQSVEEDTEEEDE